MLDATVNYAQLYAQRGLDCPAIVTDPVLDPVLKG